jgi:hypothetical protein
MPQVFHLPSVCAALVSLALLLWAHPALAAGQTEINYTKDGKATATACMAHLAGKPPTTAINQAGFETRKNTRKVAIFQKWPRGGLLPRYVSLALLKEPKDPTRRSCNISLSFPSFLMVETSSPDFKDFATALSATLKSGGYKKSGTTRNAFGVERDVWTGPHGAYTIWVTAQNSVVTISITPE